MPEPANDYPTNCERCREPLDFTSIDRYRARPGDTLCSNCIDMRDMTNRQHIPCAEPPWAGRVSYANDWNPWGHDPLKGTDDDGE